MERVHSLGGASLASFPTQGGYSLLLFFFFIIIIIYFFIIIIFFFRNIFFIAVAEVCN